MPSTHYRLFVLLLLAASPVFAWQDSLFRITQHGRIGYIDAHGRLVIPAIYHNAYDFNEGLAAVRENGLFGFIDTSGGYVIQPSFDKATCFKNGVAEVIKAGQPRIIDRTGQVILPSVYISLEWITPRKAVVSTKDYVCGLMDMATRQLLTDTIYYRLDPYPGGIMIGAKRQPHRRKFLNDLFAVIDTLGQTIVPLGKYETINPFSNGVAVVQIARRKSDYSDEGAIDIHGNLLFRRSAGEPGYINGEYNNGLAVWTHGNDHYEGYVDLTGKLVLSDTSYNWVKDFSRGRGFVVAGYERYYLIDTTFKILNPKPYEDVQNGYFNNGYAVVKTESGWNIIDTAAQIVMGPEQENIETILNGRYVVVVRPRHNEPGMYEISALSGQPLNMPRLQQYDGRGFVNGLLQTVTDNKLTYFNEAGKKMWQEQPDTATCLRRLNVDFMRREGFRAAATQYNDDDAAFGGWGSSGNAPRKYLPTVKVQPNQLSVVIDTTRIDTLVQRYYGFSLYVVNAMADTIRFNAQDSRLYMKLQALDTDGKWKYIEYLPESFCGNSYHRIALEPGACWKFSVPDYEGQSKTLLRAELKYIDPANPKKEKIVYSNQIIAGINPAQFSVKLPYYPRDIMDPYVE